MFHKDHDEHKGRLIISFVTVVLFETFVLKSNHHLPASNPERNGNPLRL
jgi:hypothetical protein